MSSAVFTHLASTGGRSAERTERLFLAAVTAFCSLTRPSRAEIAQLSDLTLPLVERVPQATRRFAAAALCECSDAPARLVRRLCEEGLDVAAPLLMRSPALTDADLVELIGRHGTSYARAITRRAGLHPAIAALISVMLRDGEEEEPPAAAGQAADPLEAMPLPPSARLDAMAGMAEARDVSGGASRIAERFRTEIEDLPKPATGRAPGEASANAQRRLRAMMRGAPDGVVPDRPSGRRTFMRLRDVALDGRRPLFDTALADALGLSMAGARALTDDGLNNLPVALHAAGLRPEEAFLVAAALHPAKVAGSRAEIESFLARFEALTVEASDAALKRWRGADRLAAPAVATTRLRRA